MDAHGYGRHLCKLPEHPYAFRECTCGFIVAEQDGDRYLWPNMVLHREHPWANQLHTPNEEEMLRTARWFAEEAKRGGAQPIEYDEVTNISGPIRVVIEATNRAPIVPHSVRRRTAETNTDERRRRRNLL